MDSFPAFFPLHGRRVVIVGEGEAAEAKARLFEGSPAEVERLSAAAGADARAYAGAVLAFVATRDEAAAEAAARAARAAGAPVNVVDRPALCDFTTPAIVDRGAVVAAVGTAGTAPILASLLRSEIETRVPEGLGAVAALIGRMQGQVRQAFPDLARRRAFLRSVLAGPVAEAAAAGETARAEALLGEAIAAGDRTPGAVRLVEGRGPADLLTLRAARALAEADLLVIEPGAAPAVVALARRDAERAAAEQADEGLLHEAVDAGRQVVWVTAPNGVEARLLVLVTWGVAAEAVPRAG